jgi:hypothetical protein
MGGKGSVMVGQCESFYEQAAARRAFREGWKAGLVVGPLERADGVWVEVWDGFDPWSITARSIPARKSEGPAVNDVEADPV